MASFLIDEDLPTSLAGRLRQKGHESTHVIELGQRGAPDARVFQLAQERRAVPVSHDTGFANILQYPLGSHYGIVVVRFPSEVRTQNLAVQLVEQLTALRDDEFAGTLILLEPGRIRIRRPRKNELGQP
jgi:predicted nuclease of predicted toxin-antitoxin system